MAMLYVNTAEGFITAYPIEPGNLFVGQDDLFEILSMIKELKTMMELDDADLIEQHELSCKRGL